MRFIRAVSYIAAAALALTGCEGKTRQEPRQSVAAKAAETPHAMGYQAPKPEQQDYAPAAQELLGGCLRYMPASGLFDLKCYFDLEARRSRIEQASFVPAYTGVDTASPEARLDTNRTVIRNHFPNVRDAHGRNSLVLKDRSPKVFYRGHTIFSMPMDFHVAKLKGEETYVATWRFEWLKKYLDFYEGARGPMKPTGVTAHLAENGLYKDLPKTFEMRITRYMQTEIEGRRTPDDRPFFVQHMVIPERGKIRGGLAFCQLAEADSAWFEGYQDDLYSSAIGFFSRLNREDANRAIVSDKLTVSSPEEKGSNSCMVFRNFEK